MTIALTLFERPEKPVGQKFHTTWRAVVNDGAIDSDAERKEDLGQWSAVEFAGDHRSAVRAQRIHAVVLDADGEKTGGLTMDQAHDALADVAHWLVSTWSDSPNDERFRIVVPLARPVSLEDWPKVWTYCVERVDGRVDQQAKSCGHAWLRPAPRRSGFRSRVYSAPALRATDVPPVRSVLPAVAMPSCGRPSPSVIDRAVRYLETMDGAVSGNGGHAQTYRAAAALRRGFGLDEATAYELLSALYNPRCDPPWSSRELLHKVRSAARDRRPAGFLLESSH